MYLMQFMKNEINELYDYRSPLVWALRYGNEKVAQALREMGMRCGLRCDGGRKSGMMDTGYFAGQNSGMTFLNV